MLTPTQRYYHSVQLKPSKVSSGIDQIPDRISGAIRRRSATLGRLRRHAAEIGRRIERLQRGTAEDHAEQIARLHARFRRQRGHDRKLLTEALAHIALQSQRTLGLLPYPVQIMGALALHHGDLAEMATGEGKTLTIALAAVLAGWRGKPCHIVTANDYLAQRDAESLAPLFQACGIGAGYISAAMEPDERRQQYEREVVYCTSQELLADFLRDQLRLGTTKSPSSRLMRQLLDPSGGDSDGLIQRGLHTAIVDEADSVLIDEAVTPLIISQSHPNDTYSACCETAAEIAALLQPGLHYRVHRKRGEVELTRAGVREVGRYSGRLSALWRSLDRRNSLVRQALTARELFERDKHYVIKEGKIEIVDELSGRLMPGRTWRQGLHQAIEAKEGLAISNPSETLASMSFQRFFRLFRHLSGLTGTASESTWEFWHIYRLAVIRIPTHRRPQRKILPSRLFSDLQSKWNAVVEATAQLHAEGRPLLLATRTVEASELLSRLLRERRIPHQVLNAVKHQQEAEIIRHAGRPGQVTIATNMAGRGTDIKVAPEALEQGGLHVIITERNTSARIDRQLVGRTARQGDPGSVQFFLSLEDELFTRYLTVGMRLQIRQAMAMHAPGARALALLGFARAQRVARRLGEQQRHAVLRMDNWLDEHLAFTGHDGY